MTSLSDKDYSDMYQFLYSRHLTCWGEGISFTKEAQTIACGLLFLNTKLKKKDVSRVSNIPYFKCSYRITRHCEKLEDLDYAILTNRYWKQLQEEMNNESKLGIA